MSKLLSLLTAGTLALAASGFVSAADEPYPSTQSGQSQNQTTPGTTEYLAALKKCEAINNAGDRQKCVDAAKKKHGQM
jgi:hypothetical protein